eukprot:TRINITY_DN20668_c0_g1_i1.p1 TRINITY_DN20668_c0_g1~~TRINITY_DN20668_c0_g1_i1.p1  ORF type:complete len:959 (+),score=188.71 TRINITY_DN20668_c0_g1_i1:152-3028(+)
MDGEELADDKHIAALVRGVRLDVCSDEAKLASASNVADVDVVLDALLIGPSKSGKSTVMNSLMGQVVCPSGSVATTLFPVAFGLGSSSAEEDGQFYLRVPEVLRARLIAAGATAIPEDGLVRDATALEARLDTLNRAGRAAAEDVLADAACMVEPVEVTRCVAAGANVGAVASESRLWPRNWRIVDFPGTTERSDSAPARLIRRLLEERMKALHTAVLFCVVAKDQVGSETAETCFELVRACGKPRLWLVNKLDNEGDYHEVQHVRHEIDRLAFGSEGERVLHIAALQVLAHECAQSLRRHHNLGDSQVLPPTEEELERDCPREVEVIVRALVPAASRASKNWKRQYANAARCSWAQLCSATQFPSSDAGQEEDEENSSDNASLRSTVWWLLAHMKARLVLGCLLPLTREATRSHEAMRPIAEVEDLRESVTSLTSARDALQWRILSESPQGHGQLARSIVDISERNIQLALDQANTEESSEEVDLLAKMNSALEAAEEELGKLQHDWVVQGDPQLERICDSHSLVEPVSLISEVERKSGIARTFESALFMLFAKFRSENSAQKDWFNNTGSMYMKGIRETAPAAANHMVDTARSQLSAARKTVEADLAQAMWDLVDVDTWCIRLKRLQGLFLSLLWLQQSLQADPVADVDMELLAFDQQTLLSKRIGVVSAGNSIAQLGAVDPDSTWWMTRVCVFGNTLYAKLFAASENQPRSAEEVIDVARQLAYAHAVSAGLQRPVADEFLRQLIGSCDRLAPPEQVVSDLWTSKPSLNGKEFSALVNESIREDAKPALPCAVRLVLALGPLHLSRLPPPATVEGEQTWWPVGGRVYRGGWLPREGGQEFFAEGRRYRSPAALLATPSFDEALALACRGAAPADGRLPVVWTIYLDAKRRSADAFLLGRLDNGIVLFAPYACFHVRKANWQSEATMESPHQVEVQACVDPQVEDSAGTLPLSNWG